MKIFLSYANEDKSIADRIARTLRNDKHEVFYSEDTLAGSDAYSTLIRQAIESSDLFIFLISPDSVKEGSYTLTELRFAQDKWKTPSGFVMPAEIRATDYKTVPAYLSTITIWKAVGNLEAELAAEVAKIAKGRAKQAIPHPSSRVMLMTAGAFVLGGVIGLYPQYACWLGLPGCKAQGGSVAIVTVKCVPSAANALPRYAATRAYVLVKGDFDPSATGKQIDQLKRLEATAETSTIDHNTIFRDPHYTTIRNRVRGEILNWTVLSQPVGPDQVDFPLPKLGEAQSAHFFIDIENTPVTGDPSAGSPSSGIRELANFALEEDSKANDLAKKDGIAPKVTKVNLNLYEGEILCWENTPPQ
jgi:hypothetical protein